MASKTTVYVADYSATNPYIVNLLLKHMFNFAAILKLFVHYYCCIVIG